MLLQGRQFVCIVCIKFFEHVELCIASMVFGQWLLRYVLNSM